MHCVCCHRRKSQRKRKVTTGMRNSQRLFKYLMAEIIENFKKLPYRVASLLYCFNRQGQALLMQRAQEPNLGLWSPCGGKLRMDEGESPYACACREASEEIGLNLEPG